MKHQIMLDMLMILLARRKMTAKQLAERYGISTRSVYRYIAELDSCGIPLEVSRGRYGGIMVADTYRLPSNFFTRDEYASVVNALNAMSSQINDVHIFSALEKIQNQQKSEKRETSVCGNVIVEGGSWVSNRKFSDKLRVCERAVNERLRLMIDYYSRNGEHSKRVIDPHVLIYKQNVWYVYAYCHSKQTFRTFKIGRIKSAVYTGETFTRREFNRDDINLNFYDAESNILDVVFEIDKSSLADAEDWLGIENIEPRGNAFVARLPLPDDGGLVNKILSYGGAIKVLEPESLRQRVIDAAKVIIGEN